MFEVFIHDQKSSSAYFPCFLEEYCDICNFSRYTCLSILSNSFIFEYALLSYEYTSKIHRWRWDTPGRAVQLARSKLKMHTISECNGTMSKHCGRQKIQAESSVYRGFPLFLAADISLTTSIPDPAKIIHQYAIATGNEYLCMVILFSHVSVHYCFFAEIFFLHVC